jgi:hypothetical protein
MRILFVTFSSIDSNYSSTFRNKSILNGFVKLGHLVDVISSFDNEYSKADDSRKYNINGKLIVVSQNAFNKNKQNNNSLLKKIARILYHKFSPFDLSLFYLRRINLSLLPTYSYDIVVSSSDPITSHLAVRQLIRQGLKYKKWIQYWGDPLSKDITNKLIYPEKIKDKLEYWILKPADKIIYVSPVTVDSQKKLFTKLSEKMFFLPTPYSSEKKYSNYQNDTFKVGYHGFYMSSVRNIIPLYNAVNNSKLKIELDIIGDSNLSLTKSNKVNIYPNKHNIEEYIEKTDLLIVLLNSSGGQIPGKIYHLSGTNKPILVILDGECKDLIKKYFIQFDRFLFCNNDSESILNAIQKVFFEKPSFEPCHYFSPEVLSVKFIS